MSLFEIGNYVIVDDKYIGKIIKKIWNGYGVIISLENEKNYIDPTITQYKLLDDVIQDNKLTVGLELNVGENKLDSNFITNSNDNLRGYMLVKSTNKMRLVNVNNLGEILDNELKKELFVGIDEKISNNLAYFKSNILKTVSLKRLTEIPLVFPVAQVPQISEFETTGQVLKQYQQLAQSGGSKISNQMIRLKNYTNEEKLSEIKPHVLTNKERKLFFNDKRYQQYNKSNIKNYQNNIIGGVYNPYLGNVIQKQNSQQKPQLINTWTGGSPNLTTKIQITENIDEPRKEYLTVSPHIQVKPKLPIINSVSIYQKEDIHEDDYLQYINQVIEKLFTDEDEVDYEESFNDGRLYAKEAEQLNVLEEGQRINVIKPAIKFMLEKFEPISENLYYDLTNTLLYKHLMPDNRIDNVAFGTQLIKKIKTLLLGLQEKIKFEDGRDLLDQINLFGYLKFKISGGYIIIENENYDIENTTRTITKELIPNLKIFASQYGNPINYKILSSVILENKTPLQLQSSRDTVLEALNILAQDYYICLQPRPEYLLWTLTRLILCWYSDPELNDNIFKIKVLINLYRARGIKEFNQDTGVQPVILIIPKYGRQRALKILSQLSYYFFPYKNVGWKDSNPSYFNKSDDLIHYTNGSIDLKKYIQYLIKSKNKIISPVSKDMTKISLPNDTNDIEFNLPK